MSDAQQSRVQPTSIDPRKFWQRTHARDLRVTADGAFVAAKRGPLWVVIEKSIVAARCADLVEAELFVRGRA